MLLLRPKRRINNISSDFEFVDDPQDRANDVPNKAQKKNKLAQTELVEMIII